MTMKVLNKVNAKVKFLYRRNNYLTLRLKKLQPNALIQSHFDYGCTLWFPHLNKNLKHKVQAVQNKCIRLCLDLPSRSHTDVFHLEKITRLSISERLGVCLETTAFKY